ncbi:MAG: LLM class flavin-dependent oxidoreductase [Candidatus Binatia bacterium]
MLVPLHDPVRLAEQLATASLVSGGRVGFVAGLGYRHEEFAMADVEFKRRGRLMEEYVEVMRRAWTGEPFEWRGRTIRVTPAPASPPMVLVGGSTEKAAKRAAKLRAGFFPAIGDPALAELYQQEASHVGFQGGFVALPNGPVRARVRGPRARLAAPRAARALRRADVRRVADPRPALADARPRQFARRREAKRCLRGSSRPTSACSSSPTPAASSSTRSWAVLDLALGWRACACSSRRCRRASSERPPREDAMADLDASPNAACNTSRTSRRSSSLGTAFRRHLDLKQWDEMAGLFIADATVCYSSGRYEFEGRRTCASCASRSAASRGSVTIHHGHHPEITVTADQSDRHLGAVQLHVQRAREPRNCIGRVLRGSLRQGLLRLALEHIGYRLFHEEWKRDDIPSLTLG